MGMTDQLFSNSIEAQNVISDLRTQLRKLPFNRDLIRLCENLESMVSDLSSEEVKARRTRKTNGFDKKAAELQKNIVYFQQLIIIHRLRN